MYKKCNSKFCDFVDHIYPIEFEINDIVDATRSASYLYIPFDIYSECRLKTKFYDKREVFNLYVATFQQHLYMEYTVYLSVDPIFQSLRFLSGFFDRELLLRRKLLNQWFLLVKLKSSLGKFYGIGYVEIITLKVL